MQPMEASIICNIHPPDVKSSYLGNEQKSDQKPAGLGTVIYPQSRHTRLLFHRHVDLQFRFRSLTHCFQRVEDISDTFFVYCTFFGNIRNTIAVAKHGCNGAGHGLWDDGGRSRWCGWHGNSPGCSYSFSCWMGLGEKRTAFTILRARQGLLRGTCTKLHAK